MSDVKTVVTGESVDAYLAAIPEDQKRADAQTLHALFEEVTGEKGKMWGEHIVGYGSYRYKYASGREGDWPKAGFSPRKNALTIYLDEGFTDNKDLMDKLGKYTTSKVCLYIKRLSDVDLSVVRELIKQSYERAR